MTDILNNINTKYKNDNAHNDRPIGISVANRAKG